MKTIKNMAMENFIIKTEEFMRVILKTVNMMEEVK